MCRVERSADDNLKIRIQGLMTDAMQEAQELGSVFPGNVKLEAIHSYHEEILGICRSEILEANQLTFAFAASSANAKEIADNREQWHFGLLRVFELLFARLVTTLKNRRSTMPRGLAPHLQRVYAPKARSILIEFFDYEAGRVAQSTPPPVAESTTAEVSGG